MWGPWKSYSTRLTCSSSGAFLYAIHPCAASSQIASVSREMSPGESKGDLVRDRVVHRFGQTHRFCCMGVAGTGTVLDLPTCANTVPVMGNLQVSTTCSHTHTHEWCHLNIKSPLPCAVNPMPS